MPDKRAHRGPHPDDAELFSTEAIPRLREAVADLAWLLGRGYAEPSALKVVGDRYNLTQRQRTAVMRCTCTDEAVSRRSASRASSDDVRGKELLLDGYNVLTTVEAALAGGVVLLGRDGSLRDAASMHGTWRKVEETRIAIELIGEVAHGEFGFTRLRWLLDSPVSNSGRLKTILQAIAHQRTWDWDVRLVPNPDADLSVVEGIVATADSVILNRCRRWFPLAGEVVRRRVPGAWWVDLSTPSTDRPGGGTARLPRRVKHPGEPAGPPAGFALPSPLSSPRALITIAARPSAAAARETLTATTAAAVLPALSAQETCSWASARR